MRAEVCIGGKEFFYNAPDGTDLIGIIACDTERGKNYKVLNGLELDDTEANSVVEKLSDGVSVEIIRYEFGNAKIAESLKSFSGMAIVDMLSEGDKIKIIL